MRKAGRPLTRLAIGAFAAAAATLIGASVQAQDYPARPIQVIVPYILYVHGHPVAFAQGEQEYFPKNRDQSFGDAIEATVASALRRCAKHLGVGLELWDKRWLYEFLTTRCVQVKVRDREGKPQTKWRLKDGPPLPYEIGGSSQAPAGDFGGDTWREELEEQAPAAKQTRQAPSAGTTDKDNDPITLEQRDRLKKIAEKRGRLVPEVALFLKKTWGVKSSKEIKRKDYDTICAQLEAKGPLPLPGDGE